MENEDVAYKRVQIIVVSKSNYEHYIRDKIKSFEVKMDD